LVEQADILCTCTSIGVGEGPLFENVPTKPGLHVNAVGSDFPGKTELPYGLVESGLVVPDFRPQAELEGECQVLLNANLERWHRSVKEECLSKMILFGESSLRHVL
jgi:ornithine cyclodeaminase/alanine dehydrogenase-like protein (mu-crystallin family)